MKSKPPLRNFYYKPSAIIVFKIPADFTCHQTEHKTKFFGIQLVHGTYDLNVYAIVPKIILGLSTIGNETIEEIESFRSTDMIINVGYTTKMMISVSQRDKY